jgi:N-acetylglucosaminyl-diphospho-decaprenol L-rhamnosyltransferase
MQDIAIVIVNYNTRDDLDRCLATVPDAAAKLSYQAIVVDNASHDGSASMVRERHPWATVIETDQNGGYAYANNIGLRSVGLGQPGSSYRYALLLNPDTLLPPRALSRMVAFMDANQDVGVSGPKLVRRDGSLDRACRRSFPSPVVSFCRLSGLSNLFPNSRVFGRYNLTYLDEDAEADVDAVVGAFMLIRAEALAQAGLLDESFFMYGEDLDLCYRIKERGWRVVYHPQVTITHLKGASSRKASLRATVAFYDAMRIFHDKHYRARTPAPVNWAIDGAIALLKWGALLRNRLRSPMHRRVASA